MVASPERYCYCSAYRDEARENLTPAAEAVSSGCSFGTGKPVPFRCQPCTSFLNTNLISHNRQSLQYAQ
jgi:hypothetical protein